MEDVDLRFVERLVTALEYGPDVVKTVRVLQWRKKTPVCRGGGMTFYEWTEWEDVPLVREE